MVGSSKSRINFVEFSTHLGTSTFPVSVPSSPPVPPKIKSGFFNSAMRNFSNEICFFRNNKILNFNKSKIKI